MSKRKYVYAAGRGGPVPAQQVGEVLESIEARDGAVTPAAIVNEARPEESALHPIFEWDDMVAAERYREVQASHTVRSVRVVTEDGTNGVRQTPPAFVSVTVQETGRRGYVTTAKALSDEEYRSQVLAEALAQIAALQRRYRHLAALQPIWESLQQVAAG